MRIVIPLLLGIVVEIAALVVIIFSTPSTEGVDILPNSTNVLQQKKTNKSPPPALIDARSRIANACDTCIMRVNAFYGPEIKRVAREIGIDWRLLTAMVATEVGGMDTPLKMAKALGTSGEVGLMQIKSVAASEVGTQPHELYDPISNLRTGGAYFLKLKEEMRSNRHALLAYNEGMRGAKNILSAGVRPEDHRYVQKVSANAAVLGFQVK